MIYAATFQHSLSWPFAGIIESYALYKSAPADHFDPYVGAWALSDIFLKYTISLEASSLWKARAYMNLCSTTLSQQFVTMNAKSTKNWLSWAHNWINDLFAKFGKLRSWKSEQSWKFRYRYVWTPVEKHVNRWSSTITRFNRWHPQNVNVVIVHEQHRLKIIHQMITHQMTGEPNYRVTSLAFLNKFLATSNIHFKVLRKRIR